METEMSTQAMQIGWLLGNLWMSYDECRVSGENEAAESIAEQMRGAMLAADVIGVADELRGTVAWGNGARACGYIETTRG